MPRLQPLLVVAWVLAASFFVTVAVHAQTPDGGPLPESADAGVPGGGRRRADARR